MDEGSFNAPLNRQASNTTADETATRSSFIDKPLSVNSHGKAETPPQLLIFHLTPSMFGRRLPMSSAGTRRVHHTLVTIGRINLQMPLEIILIYVEMSIPPTTLDRLLERSALFQSAWMQFMGAMIHLRDLVIFDLTLTAQPHLTIMDQACLPAVSQETIVHHYRRPDLNVEGREILSSIILIRKPNTWANLRISIVWTGISEFITSSAQLHAWPPRKA